MYEAFDVFAMQQMTVSWQMLKQLRTGFDKRPTRVDTVPYGDDSIPLLHCAAVCIIIRNVVVLFCPVVAVY